MVGLYWNWNPVWYILMFIIFAIWFPIFVYRKSWKRKNEWQEQIAFGVIGFSIPVTMEILGVFMNAWHYTDGDWPVVLFIFYFFGGFAGFQLFKFIDERWKK